MIFLCKVLFFNDRFNKYYVFDVYCTDFANVEFRQLLVIYKLKLKPEGKFNG